MIDRGDFGDFKRDIDDDETLDGSEPYADNVISVQNITNIIPAYAPRIVILYKYLGKYG